MTLRVFDFRCMNEYTHSVDLLHIDLGLLTGECFLKVQFVVSLNWRQSISHHITSLSGNAYFMSGRCMWNRKGSFVKSSRFEDRTFFAEQSLVDLELETCIYIDVCSLARQGVPACLCIFVSRYIRYIYETHIISKPGNIFHTWSIWRVKSSPKIRLQHDRLGKSLGLTVFFKGPLVYFFPKIQACWNINMKLGTWTWRWHEQTDLLMWLERWQRQSKSGGGSRWWRCRCSVEIRNWPLDPKTMKNEGFKPPIYGL